MSLPASSIAAPHETLRIGGRAARWLMAALLLTLGACSSGPDGRRIGSTPPVQGGYKVGIPYQIRGVWYYPKEDFNYNQTGIASWYGHPFHGRTSASGERYDMNAMTAAHKTLPMPSLVEVTNLENGRRAVLRLNDRGPFVSGRIIDVSRAAAQKLGFKGSGIAHVRVRILQRESRQMKQLAIANMNGQARALAARRRREAETPAQVAAKPPEYQPVAQPAARAAAKLPERPPERPVPRRPATPVASDSGNAVAAAPAANPQKPRPVETARPVRKRGGIEVSELPPSGRGSQGAGQGVYRSQPATGTGHLAGTHGSAGVGRVAGRRDSAARPKASAILAARSTEKSPPVRRQSPSPPRRAAGGDELPGRIYVQAGAFRDQTNAIRTRGKLSRLGSVQVLPVRVGGARYFRVRIGPVTSANQGNRLLARVVDAGYPRAQIVID